MLRRTELIYGFNVRGTDGDVGTVQDFYFDPETWDLRYIVVTAGDWLDEQRMLISVEAVHRPDWEAETIRTSLTRQQIEDSPDVDLTTSVSAESLSDLHAYYGWTWWGGPGVQPGPVVTPMLVPPPPMAEEEKGTTSSEQTEVDEEPRLRSVRGVSGYRIHAKDGDIGYSTDFFVDTANWDIHYMLVDTGTWLSGREVLVSTDWIEEMRLGERRIHVDLEREEVRNSPEYDFEGPVDREYETLLHQHYRREGYWKHLGH
jgi:hypothetical protein